MSNKDQNFIRDNKVLDWKYADRREDSANIEECRDHKTRNCAWVILICLTALLLGNALMIILVSSYRSGNSLSLKNEQNNDNHLPSMLQVNLNNGYNGWFGLVPDKIPLRSLRENIRTKNELGGWQELSSRELPLRVLRVADELVSANEQGSSSALLQEKIPLPSLRRKEDQNRNDDGVYLPATGVPKNSNEFAGYQELFRQALPLKVF